MSFVKTNRALAFKRPEEEWIVKENNCIAEVRKRHEVKIVTGL